MAKFYCYSNENGQRKQLYIKTIDFNNGHVTFTEQSSNAMVDDRGGYYEKAARDQMQALLSEDYPCLKKVFIEDEW